jgi:nicotinamidase-related amidase
MSLVDRRGTALLVVDVQKGLFERAQPIYEAGRRLQPTAEIDFSR